MRLIRASHTACDGAREALSLALDGELSELEQARLDQHLARCVECRAFDAESAAVSSVLRSAPLEQLSVPIVLPRPRRLSVARMMQAGAAAAAIAIVAGLSAVHSIGQRESAANGVQIKLSPTASLGHDDEVALLRHAPPRIDFRTAL
jgi:predicted anti-sigma-YlaC factor YlaD